MLVLVVAACSSPPPPPSTGPLAVGALLDLTGDWSTLGESSAVALALAESAIDSGEIDGAVEVAVEIEDTAGDPDKALAAIKQMHGRGITVFVGPQSSAEVRAVTAYANINELTVISQGSTSTELSKPDSVFRFVPDGMAETDALAALMREDGIEVVIPIWRKDAGNTDLQATMRKSFEELGGTTTAGVQYQEVETNFDTAIGSLRNQLASQLTDRDPSRVGIYLAGFGEVVDIFEDARQHPQLSSVRWYGSDGVVNNPELIEASSAAAYAVEVGYPNPIFGLDPALRARWLPTVTVIEEETGVKPDAYAIAAYDALVVAAKAEALRRLDPNLEYNEAFRVTADTHDGLNGSTALNSAGDRIGGDFSYWAVCRQAETYVETYDWQFVGHRGVGGEIHWNGCSAEGHDFE